MSSRTLFISVYADSLPGQGGQSPKAVTFFLEWRELGSNAIYNRCRVGVLTIIFADKTAAGQTRATEKGISGMARVIKLVVLLVVLGFVGLVGYAYLADMTPVRQEVKQPVVLNAE